ncbi:MAG: MFS transporter [Verrucomicrobiaceae bacterium]|nr:MFS transporter [Verrucomicrobiaceae bacterium]
MNSQQPQSPTSARFIVLLLLCLAAAIAYVSRNAIAVAESTVRADLSLSKEQSGWLMSAFFLPYALCQIPGAAFGQRFGARVALPVFAMVWSLSTAASAIGGFAMMLVMRVAKGISQAGLFPVSAAVISRWFPSTGRAFAGGALGGFMSVGGAIGAALTGWLVVQVGWRTMFVIYSVPGLIWAAMFWIWFRNSPREHGGVNETELSLLNSAADLPAGRTHTPVPWLRLATSPAMWCICGQQFCCAAAYMFFASWFATYLQEARGVTIIHSGLLNTLPLIGVVGGSLAGGHASDLVMQRTGSRRMARQGVTMISLGLCAVLTFAAMFVSHALGAVLLISAGAFFASVAGPCCIATTIDMGGEHVAAVNSVMNMCGNFGAMLFPLVVPHLLKQTGSWDAVLVSFGCLYIVAMLCWWLIKPDGTVFDQALIRSSLSSETK